jgi:NDP-sugar pyrophosphorylase family protein
VVDPSATLIGGTAVGEGAIIGEGAILEDVVVWPGEIVEPATRLCRVVLAAGRVCESVG